MARVLVIEDEERQAELLRRGLSAEGHEVEVALNGKVGLERAQSQPWDLLVVDRMLPGRSGLDVCRRFRADGGVAPILFLTARDSTRDVVEGLDAGADDYLVKPFVFDELLARIRTLLRRSTGLVGSRLTTGPIVLDLGVRRAWSSSGELGLTTKEFQLLELLMRRRGSIVARELLLGVVWDQQSEPASNALEVHISSLRKKLGLDASMIRTVRGIGYVLREDSR